MPSRNNLVNESNMLQYLVDLQLLGANLVKL